MTATPKTLTDEMVRAVDAAVRVTLHRDTHLERCELARKGGPDATLACVECGRAKWMHGTRHDTCGQFSYVHGSTITELQIVSLRHVPSIPHEIKVQCSRALNEFGLAPGLVRDAKRQVAGFINYCKRRASDALNAAARSDS